MDKVEEIQPSSLRASEYPTHSIPLSQISIQPQDPKLARARKTFKNIIELAESIRTHGLINPVLITRTGPDKYLLVAGERRLRAHMHLQLKLDDPRWDFIDCRIREELPDLVLKELELMENVQRSDLDWQEKCELMAQINQIKTQIHGSVRTNPEKGWSKEKTAEVMGVSPSQVSAQIKLAQTLKDRPDLKERTKGMSQALALRVIDQTLEGEKAERLVKSGAIELNASILHGSCLDLIKAVPSESVHLVLTDPPYGIEDINESKGQGGCLQYLNLGAAEENMTLETANKLLFELFPELKRVLAPGACLMIFCSADLWPSLVNLCQMNDLGFCPYPLIWNKDRAMSPFMGYRFSPCYELILHAWKPLTSDADKKCRRFNEAEKAILTYSPVATDENKIHRFQKPQGLLMRLIKLLTNHGQRVLDPFAGSGSTIKAARTCGRSALGFELNEDNFNKAQVWLNESAGAKVS